MLNLSDYKKYKVSLAVCFICILVYVFGFVFSVKWIYQLLSFGWSLEVMELQPHRYVTPIFLHFHIIHIGFNLAIWWYFAKQLETLWGGAFLILFVLIVGFVSNLAQFFVSGPNFGGLSGVDFGLVGYAWLSNYLSDKPIFIVPPGLMVQIIILLVLGFSGILDFLIGPIANTAHLAGLIAGFFLALTMRFKRLKTVKSF